MTLIEAVRGFIAQCPFIDEMSGGLHIDFTSEDPGNYGVFQTGEGPVKTYTNGDRVMEYRFSLCAREYTPEDAQRLENIGFVEGFSRWLEEKSSRGELPNLGVGRVAQRISSHGGILFDIDDTGETGLYQVQCSMIYFQEGVS